MAKYYIIAGEASGDLHAGNLLRAINRHDASANCRAWGGDNLKAAGATLVKHIKSLAFMGFWEVIKNLRTILSNIELCKKDILAFQPDVVILVDYPGFNFRLLKFLKSNGFKVVWYISPQVWAWKEGRVKQIKKYVDKLLVIFPFEVDFYKKWDVEAIFVGHPLLDVIPDKTYASSSNVIALLPGSRKQEIDKMLPLYNAVAGSFQNEKFKVAGMSIHGSSYYTAKISSPNIELVIDKTYEVLNEAKAALVTSGTATMETALHFVPQVVCYKGSYFSYFIGRMLVKVPFIAMVNLVCGKKVVEELIQHDANVESVKSALGNLFDEQTRTKMLKEYEQLRLTLGGSGASESAAKEIVQMLGGKATN